MDSILIIYPIFPVILLNFIVMVHMRVMIQKAIRTREVRYRWFRAYQGSVPEYMLVARLHYKYFFEIPFLFYVLCIVLYVFDDVSSIDIWIAWLFVIFKVVHSYVRMTSNHVPFRAYAFYGCAIVLFCGWVNLAIKIF